MNKHLEKRRDELADYAAEHTNKDTEAVRHYTKWGFDACYAEMAPLIEYLKQYAGSDGPAGQLANLALEKIGVE